MWYKSRGASTSATLTLDQPSLSLEATDENLQPNVHFIHLLKIQTPLSYSCGAFHFSRKAPSSPLLICTRIRWN